MKKYKNVKSLLFMFTLIAASCTINNSVSAKTITANEIQGSSYVIGSHIFTREINETTGYQGKLTTSLIMLASQTIKSSDLDSMIIYYKTAGDMWINGLTGSPIEAPESFEINYTDLQLEEDNNTVSAPKAPIITLNGGPLSIDNDTDMMSYQLDMYIDDIDDKSNKVDGVELHMVDYTSRGINKDLPYDGENFTTISTVLDNYTGDILELGKKYHRDFITFDCPPDGHYTINARAYAKDDNGKKYYSDWVTVSFDVHDTLPPLEIVNKSPNSNSVYRLGIKIPDAYIYKSNPERFGYITNCDVGRVFALNEEFTVTVENTVESCWAQMGYIDKNGDFESATPPEKDQIYYTIDSRTLTTPNIYINDDYIYINESFYKDQERDTLDYKYEGTEIYLVNHRGNIRYELIEGKNSGATVSPPSGVGYYTARVYATNEAGERVYSDFTDFVGIIKKPLISASEVLNGKVTVTIDNTDDYRKGDVIRFKLYTTTGNIELSEIIYNGDQKAVFEIDVTENMEIYAVAYIHDDFSSGYLYSGSSNFIDIVVE